MSRLATALAAIVLGFSASAAPPAPAPVEKAQPIDGKIVPLVDALKKLGAKPDADTAGVALVAPNGAVYTLVKDAKTRLLFLDKQLLNREVRLTAKVLPGTFVLHVEKVQTIKNGKVFDVDYWCEECQLAATEPGACKCCGADTALRELPAK